MFRKIRSAPLDVFAEDDQSCRAREEEGRKFIRQISGDAWAS
jgi:hypothetical protein